MIIPSYRVIYYRLFTILKKKKIIDYSMNYILIAWL